MTCIVGIAHKGKVFIGGDSAGVDPATYGALIRCDKKVFAISSFAIGFTTSFRMDQLLMYGFKPPIPTDGGDLMGFMVVDFINAVRQCLKDGGWSSKDREQEWGGEFLVGTKGRLFRIQADYQVGECAAGVDAVGCGAHFALGALHASRELPVRKRLLKALQVSELCSAGVRRPFNIVQV